MPELTVAYEDDVLRVYWSEAGHYYLSDWLGVFRKGAHLRRAYQACVELAKRRSPSIWLADTSQLPVIDPADAKWVAEWFWPEFARAGVRYVAAVAPQKAVSKMSANRATEGLVAAASMEISVHETRAQAEAALLEWSRKHAHDGE
jgi:hypothetical protein